MIELLPRHDKRILSDVLGKTGITEHCIRTIESHVLKTDYYLGERLVSHRQGAA